MRNLKQLLIITCLVFFSVSGFAQQADKDRGLKGAKLVIDINPDFAGRWIYSEGATTFTLVLTKKNNLYVKSINATVDCLVGQFDYTKNKVVIARNINKSQEQQIIVGLPVKSKPNIVKAVYTYSNGSSIVDLELVDKNTLKWTITDKPDEGLRRPGTTHKPREIVVPNTLILKRSK